MLHVHRLVHSYSHLDFQLLVLRAFAHVAFVPLWGLKNIDHDNADDTERLFWSYFRGKRGRMNNDFPKRLVVQRKHSFDARSLLEKFHLKKQRSITQFASIIERRNSRYLHDGEWMSGRKIALGVPHWSARFHLICGEFVRVANLHGTIDDSFASHRFEITHLQNNDLSYRVTY